MKDLTEQATKLRAIQNAGGENAVIAEVLLELISRNDAEAANRKAAKDAEYARRMSEIKAS